MHLATVSWLAELWIQERPQLIEGDGGGRAAACADPEDLRFAARKWPWVIEANPLVLQGARLRTKGDRHLYNHTAG